MSETGDATVHLSAQKESKDFSLPDRFEIRGPLGQGGMGTVFLATEKMLNRDVAVKILTQHTVTDEESQARFWREAKALAQLDHPNIVKILSSGLTENRAPYHVMELLEGKPLSAELADRGTLSPGRFYQVIKQVCAALDHAHAHGIIHRDLKPSNVMIDTAPDGSVRVKIIDFGIARITGNEGKGNTITLTNAVLGSPYYMSPEQCKGAELDSRSDIYSLGCMMYECITGAPPFKGDTPFETMYMHMNSVAPSLQDKARTPDEKHLAELIDACLKKDREERPQSSKKIMELLDELFSVAALDSSLFFAEVKKKKKFPRNLSIAIVSLTILSLCAAMIMANFSRNAGVNLSNEHRMPQAESPQEKRRKHAQEVFLHDVDRINGESPYLLRPEAQNNSVEILDDVIGRTGRVQHLSAAI